MGDAYAMQRLMAQDPDSLGIDPEIDAMDDDALLAELDAEEFGSSASSMPSVTAVHRPAPTQPQARQAAARPAERPAAIPAAHTTDLDALMRASHGTFALRCFCIPLRVGTGSTNEPV
jgi:hypothetical protein